jgi:L-glyceraldehyde 3-phosphate reductase
MRYRRLGSTDLVVSEISFGCGNTAGLIAWGGLDEQVHAAQYALDLGINFFDTSPTYAQSEENLGRILPRLSERPLLSTKVDLTPEHLTAGQPGTDPGGIANAIRYSVERSLKRLGVDCIDVVHLHNRIATSRPDGPMDSYPLVTVDELLGPHGVQETFQTLQREGKLRYYGFCASGGEPAAHESVVQRGEFDSALVYYNILNPSAGRAMPPTFERLDYDNVMAKATARGIGTIVIRVLDGGALSGDPSRHPISHGDVRLDPEYRRTARWAHALEFLKCDSQETLAQVAIRFALQSPDVSTVLVGFAEKAQIEEAVTCSTREGFSAAQLARLDKLYAGDLGRPTDT